MDTLFQEFSSAMNNFNFDRRSDSLSSNQSLINGYKPNHRLFEPLPLPTNQQPSKSDSPTSSFTSEGDSSDNSDFSSVMLKYIGEILMEEDLQAKNCMLQDCLALQAAERSFYDVLGAKYPPSFNHDVGELACSEEQNRHFDEPVDSLASTIQFNGGGRGGATEIPSGVILDLEPKENTLGIFGKAAKDKRSYRDDDGDYLEEERSNKHLAFYTEVIEEAEMFDKVLLCNEPCNVDESLQNGTSRRLHQNGQSSKGSSAKTTRGKKQGNKKEVVDFSSLLIHCAQAVAGNDQMTANELLSKIRQHSSPNGDACQRLAHYFANGLEARLVGSRTRVYTFAIAFRSSAADILKSYQLYITACPFKVMSNSFANRTILKLAANATSLHIIDFGILYGFQWPCLIQQLARRSSGPLRLRITGIDFPHPGFRPAERVEETGRRLENYCKRFKVPFEYNAIAQKWETIRVEDLKIGKDELLVVNSLYRLENVLDETVVVNSPRNAVLKLIKKINPDMFIHGVVNGTFNAPFFATRFRETLFHFSALFDMFEATMPREDQERMLYEKEIFGRDSMNIIACEGVERVERPETYKQWQIRNTRAGFRQLPLDRDILNVVRSKVKSSYHKDFVVDEDGNWFFQGWKGRIIYALSCWKPSQ